MFNSSMIVASQPEAAEAGAEVLREGGNAIDAAIACAFVQGVVDPLMTGIAGFGSMALRLANGTHKYLDFHAPAPLAATADMWADRIVSEARDGYGFLLRDRVNDVGYQAMCTPASLKAYHEAHARYGTLPWERILQPAVEWAESGWAVRPHVHWFWSQGEDMGRAGNQERIRFSRTGRNIFCREDGTPKQVGDLVKNPEYAHTLRRIAREGIDIFYNGEIAHEMIDDIQRGGGLLTLKDLQHYKPQWRDPIWSNYRDFRLSTNHPPGGGLMLVQMLNILEHFDLRSLGHNSVEYIRVVSEAMKRATALKDELIGDPDFVGVPIERFADKSLARAAADDIRAHKMAHVPRFNAGNPSKDTTQVTVVDKQGNCVSMTHSLGMVSGIMTDGHGFMHNACMAVFDPRPGRTGSIAPGKARFSSLCPSIVTKDDQPYVVTGAPGATQIAMGILQTTLNVLEFNMSMTEAVSAPRFSATSDAIDVSNRIPRYITRELEGLGYQVIRSPYSFGFSFVHAIKINGSHLEGGADPGHDGVALNID